MEEVRRSLQTWVDDAIEVFVADPLGSVQENASRQSRWEADENDHFVLRDRPALSWSRPFVDAIHALPSFQQVRVAAEQDPVIGPQLDVVVGTVLARSQRRLEELAGSLLPQPILHEEVPKLPEDDVFEARWARLEDFLTENTIEMTAFWPLAGVVVEDPPLELEEGLRLDLLTPYEIDLGLRFGIIPRRFAHTPVEALDAGKRFCLRYLYRLPKLVGTGGVEDAAADAQNAFERLETISTDFVESAALVSPGRFGVLGIMEHESVQLYGHGIRWRAIAEQQLLRFGTQDLLIGTPEVDDLKLHWSRLRSAGFRERNRGISLALRRFAGHGLRQSLDDQAIDLMIAAEALYLSDLGNDKYQGELRNRLALRAAMWCEPDRMDLSRKEVFRLMQSAYDARSAIAHGGQPKPKDIKLRDERVELRDLIEATGEVLRYAISRAARAVEGSWPIPWDDLMLDQLES